MGLKLQSSIGGSVELNAPATNSNYTVTMPAQSGTMMMAENYQPSFKNRIINGAMMIDQRNAGASVTPANYAYLTDRFQFRASQSSKFTASQSATAPSGFVNSLLFTSSSAYSVGSSDQFGVRQFIEGLNIADLGWGTANAQPVTLSFWVRSSITGTHSGALGNSGDARAYPFSFTVSSANTWEQKTVTIAGDTSGTWLTNNGIGIKVSFNLGAGSSMLATAGSWTTGEIVGATGSVSVVGTNGATFFITGVQLEKGNTATSFDYRPYGTELALCQRYYVMWANGENAGVGIASMDVAKNPQIFLYPPVTMRTTPSVSQTATQYRFNTNTDENINMTWVLESTSTTPANVRLYGSASASTSNAGSSGPCRIYSGGGYLAFTAEL